MALRLTKSSRICITWIFIAKTLFSNFSPGQPAKHLLPAGFLPHILLNKGPLLENFGRKTRLQFCKPRKTAKIGKNTAKSTVFWLFLLQVTLTSTILLR
jgi:hypothetical protein